MGADGSFHADYGTAGSVDAGPSAYKSSSSTTSASGTPWPAGLPCCALQLAASETCGEGEGHAPCHRLGFGNSKSLPGSGKAEAGRGFLQ